MSRQRGLALVSVLWGVAILSLIAAAMLSASVTTAQLGHNAWASTRAGAVADQAVGRAILSLLDTRLARQPRVDGVPSAFTLDGVPVRLWIQNQSGMINVNYATADLLQGAFASAGMAKDAAAALAQNIVSQRPPSDILTSPVAFRALDEMLSVTGMTRTVLARVEPIFTVYGRNGGINRQVAPREVLRTLPGLDDDDALALFLKAREASRPAPPDDDSTGSRLGIANSDFAITVEVRLDGVRLVRSAVVQFTGDDTRPYLIMAWR